MAKARKIPYLNPDQDLRTCLSKILQTRFDEMISHEKGTLDGSDIENLHDMRVSSRRVQAVLKVFQAAFPGGEFKKQYKVIQRIKDELGEVRHFDVFIYALEEYRNKMSDRENRGLELLIIRQKMLREKKRREMTTYINGLNKRNYKKSFSEFTGKP
jgi:CHAD domain-containing protein